MANERRAGGWPSRRWPRRGPPSRRGAEPPPGRVRPRREVAGGPGGGGRALRREPKDNPRFVRRSTRPCPRRRREPDQGTQARPRDRPHQLHKPVPGAAAAACVLMQELRLRARGTGCACSSSAPGSSRRCGASSSTMPDGAPFADLAQRVAISVAPSRPDPTPCPRSPRAQTPASPALARAPGATAGPANGALAAPIPGTPRNPRFMNNPTAAGAPYRHLRTAKGADCDFPLVPANAAKPAAASRRLRRRRLASEAISDMRRL